MRGRGLTSQGAPTTTTGLSGRVEQAKEESKKAIKKKGLCPFLGANRLDTLYRRKIIMNQFHKGV